jgi:hypothetical protein
MNANSEQVGGNHYKTGGIEVWDFIEQNGIRFLEGNAIKYIARHRNKKGAEDLDKAKHYVYKIAEMLRVDGRIPNTRLGLKKGFKITIDEFQTACNLTELEAHLINVLTVWDTPEQLTLVLDGIDHLKRMIPKPKKVSEDLPECCKTKEHILQLLYGFPKDQSVSALLCSTVEYLANNFVNGDDYTELQQVMFQYRMSFDLKLQEELNKTHDPKTAVRT